MGGNGGDGRRVRFRGSRKHKFDGKHCPDAPHISDHVVFCLERFQRRAKHPFDVLADRQQPLGLDLAEDGDRRRSRDRVAAECATESAGVGGIHDLGTSGHGGERESAGDALCRQNQVGNDAEVFTGEPGASAGHAALDLVRNEDNAICKTPLLERWQIAVRRYDEPALALDGFEHQAGEVGGPDLLLEVCDGALRGIRTAQPVAKRVGIGCVVDVSRERTEAGLVWHGLERHRHREVCAPVVRVVEHGYASALRVVTRDFHGVLDRFSPGVDQNALLREIAWRVLGEQLCHPHIRLIWGDGEHGVGDFCQLGRGSRYDSLVGVPDGRDADAGTQVDKLVSVDVDDDCAIGALGVYGQC